MKGTEPPSRFCAFRVIFAYKEERPAEQSAGRFVCTVQATINSDRAGNFAGTQAPGTNIHMARRTIDQSLHALDVGLPGTIGTTVRVGNSDTERNTLVAKLALCHPLHLLAVIKSRLGHSQAVDTIADCITKCKYYFQKR